MGRPIFSWLYSSHCTKRRLDPQLVRSPATDPYHYQTWFWELDSRPQAEKFGQKLTPKTVADQLPSLGRWCCKTPPKKANAVTSQKPHSSIASIAPCFTPRPGGLFWCSSSWGFHALLLRSCWVSENLSRHPRSWWTCPSFPTPSGWHSDGKTRTRQYPNARWNCTSR